MINNTNTDDIITTYYHGQLCPLLHVIFTHSILWGSHSRDSTEMVMYNTRVKFRNERCLSLIWVFDLEKQVVDQEVEN